MSAGPSQFEEPIVRIRRQIEEPTASGDSSGDPEPAREAEIAELRQKLTKVSMAALQVPVIISVIGEGGSGGALALGVVFEALRL